MEGAELALYEVKERKRLRVEAENKAKEMEEAAMEDMMMGIEDYESEEEEEEAANEGEKIAPLCYELFLIGSLNHIATNTCSPTERHLQGWTRTNCIRTVPDVLCIGAEGRVG